VELSEKIGVFSNFFLKDEVLARGNIDWEQLIGLIEIETLTMINMTTRSTIPALKGVSIETTAIAVGCDKDKTKLGAVHAAADEWEKAKCARELTGVNRVCRPCGVTLLSLFTSEKYTCYTVVSSFIKLL